MSKIPGNDAAENCELHYHLYYSSTAIQTNIKLYKISFQNARRIYHFRLQKSQLQLTREQAVVLSQLAEEQRAILMGIDANVPRFHCPLWPCFVGGAESSTLLERKFFYTRLKNIWLETRSRNPYVAMRGLLYIWSLADSVNWAEKIEDLER
jgi:Fungal specific transcription factor domain